MFDSAWWGSLCLIFSAFSSNLPRFASLEHTIPLVCICYKNTQIKYIVDYYTSTA